MIARSVDRFMSDGASEAVHVKALQRVYVKDRNREKEEKAGLLLTAIARVPDSCAKTAVGLQELSAETREVS